MNIPMTVKHKTPATPDNTRKDPSQQIYENCQQVDTAVIIAKLDSHIATMKGYGFKQEFEVTPIA